MTQDPRQTRLEAALRANLKRRKAATRIVGAPAADTPAEPPPPPEGTRPPREP